MTSKVKAENNVQSLGKSTSVGLKMTNVKNVETGKRVLPTQRIDSIIQEKVLNEYDSLFKTSTGIFTQKLRNGTTIEYPINKEGLVMWVSIDESGTGFVVFMTCPNQFAQYITHMKDPMPTNTCGGTNTKCVKHSWSKIMKPCFFCPIRGCLDGLKCIRPIILQNIRQNKSVLREVLPREVLPREVLQQVPCINDMPCLGEVPVKGANVLTGFSLMAMKPAVIPIITLISDCVQSGITLISDCTQSGITPISDCVQLDITSEITTEIITEVVANITIDKAKDTKAKDTKGKSKVKSPKHEGRFKKMSWKEIQDSHFKSLCLNWERFGSCPFSEKEKGCLHVCGGKPMLYLQDVRNEVKHLLSIPDAIPFNAIFNTLVNICTAGLLQVNFIMANMLTSSTISNDMKAARRALVKGTLSESLHFSGLIQLWSACITASSIPYTLKEKKSTEEEKDIEEDNERYIYKRVTTVTTDSSTKSIPSKFDFSLEGKVMIESKTGVDKIVQEIARRTHMCFISIRMEEEEYRKINGYGIMSTLPSKPIKDEVTYPTIFASEKEEKKFERKMQIRDNEYMIKLNIWHEEVAMINQKASLILPSDTKSPTTLSVKNICTGGAVCRNGCDSREDVIIFDKFYNIVGDKTLTESGANKLATEKTRTELVHKYHNTILFEYMPAFIADQNAKKGTMTDVKKSCSEAHKIAVANKDKLEKEIDDQYKEWVKYHPIGKDLVNYYNYTPCLITLPEIIPALPEVIENIPEIISALPEIIPALPALPEIVKIIPALLEVIVDDFYTGMECNTIAVLNDDEEEAELLKHESPKQRKERERKIRNKAEAEEKALAAAKALEEMNAIAALKALNKSKILKKSKVVEVDNEDIKYTEEFEAKRKAYVIAHPIVKPKESEVVSAIPKKGSTAWKKLNDERKLMEEKIIEDVKIAKAKSLIDAKNAADKALVDKKTHNKN